MLSASNVIELLSSSSPPVLPQPIPSASTTVSFKPPTAASFKPQSDFCYLSDDFDSSIRLDEEEWEQSATKRRKVSLRLEDKGRGKRKSNRLSNVRSAEVEGSAWADVDEDVAKDIDLFPEASLQVKDDIIFTSSLGHAQVTEKENIAPGLESLTSDIDLPDDILTACETQYLSGPYIISDRTTRLLNAIDHSAGRGKAFLKSKMTSKKPLQQNGLKDIATPSSDEEERRPTSTVAQKRSKLKSTASEKPSSKRITVQSLAKEARVAQNARDKEQAQELKRVERAQKAREKEVAAALAEANKSKKDKKQTTKEMIVDLPMSLQEHNKAQDAQIREMLKNLGLEPTTYNSPIPNVIKWRRNVESRFDEEKGYRVVTPTEIKDEKYIMVLLSAKEFVGFIATEPGEEDLDGHVNSIKSTFPDRVPIYMIEGLRAWMGKNRNARNRAFREEVLSHEARPTVTGDDHTTTTSTTTTSKTSNNRARAPRSAPYLDEDILEDALLKLQVLHGCLIHHTVTRLDTAEWVANFTQHISTIPYKHDRLHLSTAFCMETGQVKTGEDQADTFIKMLQEIVRVTPPIAYGIAEEYPSVVALMRGFQERGPLALKEIRKCANRDGALTDGMVGQAVSRRLYNIFMSLDPGETDI